MDLRRGVAAGSIVLALVAGTTGCGGGGDDGTPSAAEVAERDREQQADPAGGASVPDRWPEELDPPEGTRLGSSSMTDDPVLTMDATGAIQGDDVDAVFQLFQDQMRESGYTVDNEEEGENDAGPTRRIDATGPEWSVIIKVFMTTGGLEDWVGITWIVQAV